MKFAATYDKGMVFQNFNEAAQFKIYTIENDRVVHMQVVDVEGGRAEFLKAQGVGILVCGKLDSAARMELMAAGIAPFPGAYGDADIQVGALLAGMLASERRDEASCMHSCETCAQKDICKGL